MSALLFFIAFAPWFLAAYLGSEWNNARDRHSWRAVPITLAMLGLILLGMWLFVAGVMFASGVHLTN